MDDNDAARILSFTVMGSWGIPKTSPVSGQFLAGPSLRFTNGEIIIPIITENLAGVASAVITFDLHGSESSEVDYQNLLDGSIVTSQNYNNERFIFAAAGMDEIKNSTWGKLKLKNYSVTSDLPIKVTVSINGALYQSFEIDLKNEVPSDFRLSQNYPNPFNPVTAIRFGLPVESKVSLRIFNLLAEEITVISSGLFAAGNYLINFNAAGLSSGIYIYRIEAVGSDGRKFTQTKKMILLK